MEATETAQVEVINHFNELNSVDVGKYIEIKEVKYNDRNTGAQRVIRLKYLSWAYALAEIKKRDPQANWAFLDPIVYPDRTMMVHCNFTCFGVTHYMWLPVINQKNQPIQNPNAFEINTAMMRCLVKAIAVHGLGLYIYAGEDLPEDEKDEQQAQQQRNQQQQKRQQQAENNNQQQPAQQKATNAAQLTPEKQETAMQKALAKINATNDPQDLNATLAFFAGTKHEQIIRNACDAKADREGWR